MAYSIWPLLMLTAMVTSLVLGLSGTNLLGVWAMLEINMVAFMGYLNVQHTPAHSTMAYFLMQSLGSVLFLLGALSPSSAGSEVGAGGVAMAGLLLKLGLAPFQWWLITIFQELSVDSLVLLSTIQKILPLSLLALSDSWALGSVVIVNSLVGALGVLWSRRLLPSLAFMSLISSSWLLLASGSLLMVVSYLFAYGGALSLLITSSGGKVSSELSLKAKDKLEQLITSSALLSLAGIPPMLGFYLKLLIIASIWWSSGSLLLGALLMATPLILFNLLKLTLYPWKVFLFSQLEPRMAPATPLASVGAMALLGGGLCLI